MAATNTTVINSLPTKPHLLNDEFTSDYYSYLRTPENRVRYKPVEFFLKDTFKDIHGFTLLDVGSGSGELVRYLPHNCVYTGLDHNQDAIKASREEFPKREFVCDCVNNIYKNGREFDTIVFSGTLFNTVDKDTGVQLDDLHMLEDSVRALTPGGYLILVTPFAYGEHVDGALFPQAEWKRGCVRALLDKLPVKITFENLSLLIGLEDRIRQQKVLPDWFITDPKQFTNKYCGTYLGSWCIIAQKA